MSSGMNRVSLLGNLGADPELKPVQNGNHVLSLRVATNESWTDKEGVKQEKTEWHRVKVFGRAAEVLHTMLRKGSPVWVDGRLSTSSYEKDGQKKYSTEVIAWDVRPVQTWPKAADAQPRPGLANGSMRAPAFDVKTSDLPF
jgi:single-strand DNA-binding protein